MIVSTEPGSTLGRVEVKWAIASRGAAGVVLATLGSTLSAASSVENPPRAAEIAVNGRVLLFTAAISIVTGLLASIVPALRLSRVDLVMCQNWIFEKDPDVVRLARRPRSLRPSL